MASIAPSQPSVYFDFRKALTENRLVGLLRMMTGFRLSYAGATIALAVSALAKTATFLLLRYFVDNIMTDALAAGGLTSEQMRTLMLIAGGFVLLAAFEGGFAFLSGRLAAYTAEGITRRLRNFLFDHIQRLSFSYHSTTPHRRPDRACDQ
ncbi:MAG: ABC transporter transmembrane domain-containing protein [Anaerolineales bacterium]